MKMAVPAAVAYREFIPSFGEWGFWLASNSYNDSSKLLSKVKSLQAIPVRTEYLDLEKLKANFVFSSKELYSKDKRVNTMTSMALFNSYLEGWERYF
jgi:spermidine synthase